MAYVYRHKIVLDLDTGVYYTSMLELSNVLGVSSATVRQRLKSKNNKKYKIV